LAFVRASVPAPLLESAPVPAMHLLVPREKNKSEA
jgi:hypothetical protein